MNVKSVLYTVKNYTVKACKYVFKAFVKVFKSVYNALAGVRNNGSRIVLGLLFFVFALHALVGLPYLNSLLAHQPDPAPGAMNFLIGLQSAGYFFVMLKVVELLCGVLLLWGRYVTLALTALAPVVVNIVAFHAFLEPNNMIMATVVAVLYSHLVWQNRKTLSALLVK